MSYEPSADEREIISALEELGRVPIGRLRERLDHLTDVQLKARVDHLVEQGLIVKTGKTRGTRYGPLPTPASPSSPAPSESPAAFAPTLAFTELAMGAISRLDVAPQLRKVVHYDQEWMLTVEPEAVLSDELLGRLNELGRTSEAGEPAGTYARRIYERLLIDLSWASSSLEGNTYTLLDTQNLITSGQLPDRDPRETQMILNHKQAIELLVEEIDWLDLDAMTVRNLHSMLMDDLLQAEYVGRIRNASVGISGSAYQPMAIPQRLEEAFNMTLARARGLTEPLRQSLFMLAFLPYLQPFIDGNKRTARLASNIPLLKTNMRPLSFVDVPRQDYLRAVLCVYELKDLTPLTELFAWAYERSCARYPDVAEDVTPPDPFRQLHRRAIQEVVRRVVAGGVFPAERFIDARAREMFSDDPDVIRFTGLVLTDLERLHEGNILRYRLRKPQLDAWQALAARR